MDEIIIEKDGRVHKPGYFGQCHKNPEEGCHIGCFGWVAGEPPIYSMVCAKGWITYTVIEDRRVK